jgi:hypothetical protein
MPRERAAARLGGVAWGPKDIRSDIVETDIVATENTRAEIRQSVAMREQVLIRPNRRDAAERWN